MAQWVPGRLKPRIFLTFRHYKGGSSAIRTGRLYPRRNPWYSFSEAESTSGHMVQSGVPRKKSPVTLPGIDPGTVRLVAQRLNQAPIIITIIISAVTVISNKLRNIRVFIRKPAPGHAKWRTLIQNRRGRTEMV